MRNFCTDAFDLKTFQDMSKLSRSWSTSSSFVLDRLDVPLIGRDSFPPSDAWPKVNLFAILLVSHPKSGPRRKAVEAWKLVSFKRLSVSTGSGSSLVKLGLRMCGLKMPGLRIGGVDGEGTSTSVLDVENRSLLVVCGDGDGDGEELRESIGSAKTGLVFAILARRFIVSSSEKCQSDNSDR